MEVFWGPIFGKGHPQEHQRRGAGVGRRRESRGECEEASVKLQSSDRNQSVTEVTEEKSSAHSEEWFPI